MKRGTVWVCGGGHVHSLLQRVRLRISPCVFLSKYCVTLTLTLAFRSLASAMAYSLSLSFVRFSLYWIDSGGESGKEGGETQRTR